MKWAAPLLLAASPAAAQSLDLRDTLCNYRGANARMIMEHRQNGRDKFRLLRIANANPTLNRYELAAFRDTIEAAYAQPRAGSTFDRRRIVSDFAKETYRTCMQRNPVNR